MASAFAFPLWILINALSSSSKQSDILAMCHLLLRLVVVNMDIAMNAEGNE
jgi:hypothetical protein